MSTQPFADMDRRLQRLYIATTGKRELARLPAGSGSNLVVEAYHYTIIPEDRVQAIFRETEPSIVPLPAVMPPPPTPPQFERTLNRRYEEFVWKLTDALGTQSSMPVRFMLKVVAIAVISALTFFCVFFIRRRRRQEH